jgi:hypothetical protein
VAALTGGEVDPDEPVEPDEPVVPDEPDEPTDGLLYSLPQVTTFNGTSDYIDTGVNLFETNKDFTVICDFMDGHSVAPSGKNKWMIHSTYENSPWNGFAFGVRNGDTTYKLDMTAVPISINNGERYRVAIVKNATDGTIKVSTLEGGTVTAISGSRATSTFSQSLMLGVIKKPDGNIDLGSHWLGTIYECKVYDYAFTKDEITAYLIGTDEPVEPDVPNELPPEYTQVEYIQSDGNQYIDTGVSGGTNAAWEIKMNALAAVATNYEMYICGDKNGAIPNLHCNTGIMKMCSNNANSTSNHLNGLDYNDHTYEYRGTNNVYVDGEPYGVVNDPTGNGWGTSTWYVFNSHGEPGLKSSMRLYYLKMWTDGVLVRDFVPAVRNSDNSRGLYDLANNVFYGNIGTGAFLIPDEVEGDAGTKLIYNMPEATTFNGNSDYIDTGIQLMSTAKNMVICIDCDFTAGLPDGAAIFHCMTESSPYNGIVLSIISDGKYSVAQQNNRISGIPTGRRKIVVACVAGCVTNAKYSDGGIIKTINGGSTYKATDKNLLIGCYQDANGNKGRFWTGTIYDFKVYEGSMTEDEIEAYLLDTVEPDEPDEPQSISPVWSDTPTYGIGNTNGADSASGSDYVTNHFKVPEGATHVNFHNAIGASYTWLTVYTYDENKTWVRTVGGAANTGAAMFNVGSTEKYLRLSAFPANVSTNNDPANQLVVTFASDSEPEEPDAPTDGLLYSLPEITTFNGVNDYIDTGVKLFDEPKDFTILLYAYLDIGNQANAAVFHCINEVSPYPGLCLHFINRNYKLFGSAEYVTGIPSNTMTKIAIVANGGAVYAVWYKGEGSEVVGCAVGLTKYVAHDFNLLLGAYQDTSGTKGRFWKGALYDFRVYDYAMTAEEVAEYVGGNPASVSIDNIEWSDTAAYKINNGQQISGTNYVTTKYVAVPDGATSVTLKNANDSTFTWQGVAQYTDMLGILEYKEGSAYTSEITVNLNGKARYVKFSAFPNNNEANIPATGLAVEFS